jgi:hypothetical protein
MVSALKVLKNIPLSPSSDGNGVPIHSLYQHHWSMLRMLATGELEVLIVLGPAYLTFPQKAVHH